MSYGVAQKDLDALSVSVAWQYGISRRVSLAMGLISNIYIIIYNIMTIQRMVISVTQHGSVTGEEGSHFQEFHSGPPSADTASRTPSRAHFGRGARKQVHGSAPFIRMSGRTPPTRHERGALSSTVSWCTEVGHSRGVG